MMLKEEGGKRSGWLCRRTWGEERRYHPVFDEKGTVECCFRKGEKGKDREVHPGGERKKGGEKANVRHLKGGGILHAMLEGERGRGQKKKTKSKKKRKAREREWGERGATKRCLRVSISVTGKRGKGGICLRKVPSPTIDKGREGGGGID